MYKYRENSHENWYCTGMVVFAKWWFSSILLPKNTKPLLRGRAVCTILSMAATLPSNSAWHLFHGWQFTSNVINITRNSHSQLPHQVVQSNFQQTFPANVRCEILQNYQLELHLTDMFNSCLLHEFSLKLPLYWQNMSCYERMHVGTKRQNTPHFGRLVMEYLNKNYQERAIQVD